MFWPALPQRVKSAFLIWGLWTLYGLNQTIHTYYQYQIWKRPLTFGRAAFGEFSFAYLCALFTPPVLYIGRRFRFARAHFFRSLAVHVVTAIVFMTAVRLSWDVIYSPKPFYMGGASFRKILYAISETYEFTFSAYVFILIAGYVYDYQQRYRSEALKAERLRTEMVNAQLQALKMQLHPHFLFNTLHTISALVRESPRTAERTIARLSDLLRLTLEIGNRKEIRLDEEIRIAELYLDIERTRYEERLTVEMRVEDGVRGALVPGFVLQPLVENAIRHGIAHLSAPGRILIEARRENSRLLLMVRNTGPGLPRSPYREGVGLSATRSRLEVLYGQEQSLQIQELPSGEVEASICLPLTMDAVRRGQDGDNSNVDRGRREIGARAAATAADG